MSYFKTTILMSVLTALFMFIGYAIGGSSGAVIALFVAGGMNFLAYWKSDTMVLKMTGAIPAEKHQYNDYYTIVEELVHKANMPMPKLYIMNQETPNAFATGRNPANSAVAVTTGLYTMMSKEELKGVIAHELAHIEHRDTLISTITATFAGAISMLANMFMLMGLFGRGENRGNNPFVGIIIMIIAPIMATIIQMAISRNREYYADKRGGELCGNPLYLASALRKLEQYSSSLRRSFGRNQSAKEKHTDATSHMYIVNHFANKGDSLFSTHPNTNNRVEALEKQAADMNVGSFQHTYDHEKSNDKKGNKVVSIRKDEHIENNPWV